LTLIEQGCRPCYPEKLKKYEKKTSFENGLEVLKLKAHKSLRMIVWMLNNESILKFI